LTTGPTTQTAPLTRLFRLPHSSPSATLSVVITNTVFPSRSHHHHCPNGCFGLG
jgi:hypothetical protein